MSTLIKPIEKRIQEIIKVIAAHEAELAAYQGLLQIELLRENGRSINSPMVALQPSKSEPVSSDVPTTNKTAMVAEIVTSYGSAGATPKDVDSVLTSRKVKRSNNMVYTALSYLTSRKKLRRLDGRYFGIGTKARTKAKRKFSPEGLQRIKDASKKRWAAVRKAAGKHV